MSSEKEFDKINMEVVSDKVANLMLKLATEKKEMEPAELFNEVKKEFTTDELVFVTTMYVIQKLEDVIDIDPQVGEIIDLINSTKKEH